jgi:DNA-binding transcriptional LysR family regulator
MNLAKIDLNLLVYLDVLLRERNVTKAAQQLHITQPAMSNGLKRLRDLLKDPVLVRTSGGMEPTERALELRPVIRNILLSLEETLQPVKEFDANTSDRVFRIMVSDYAASSILPIVFQKLESLSPNISLDIMTPSDVSFHDVENGKVDLAINRFEELPQSFHQKMLWRDPFSVMTKATHPIIRKFSLEAYLKAQHIWVSKTGYGIGVGMDPKDVQKLGWVDEALAGLGKKRNIRVFTRNYHIAMDLAAQQELLVTLPTRAAHFHRGDPRFAIVDPPFHIPPVELKMIWSPLLHHDASHQWFRKVIVEAAEQVA